MSIPIQAPDLIRIINDIRSELQAFQRKILNTPVPSARVYNNANISHATSATFQALTFNSERWDSDEIHSTSSNTGRLTCNTAGLYLITGHIEFAANATGNRGARIRLGGSTNIASALRPAATGGDISDVSVAVTYRLAETEYVELLSYQSSGGALNVLSSANFSPEFSMTWISP
jgi:hypothetical protein